MKGLGQIMKENGQDPSLANQTGKFEFDPKAGCLVYQPPGIKSPKTKSPKKAKSSKN